MDTLKKRMLIVDDSEIDRIVLANVFKDSFEILQASNGLVAIDLLKNDLKTINIIIIDVYMPNMNGKLLLTELKSNKKLQKIPVIIVSGANDPAVEAELLERGAVDFLNKPINPRIARKRIENIMRLVETGKIEEENDILAEANKNAMRYRIIAELSHTILIEYDYLNKSLYVDENFNKEILGDISKVTPTFLLPLQDIAYRQDYAVIKNLAMDISKGVANRLVREVRFKSTNGMYEWYRFSVSLVRDAKGNKQKIYATLSNINSEAEAKQRLANLAEKDALTQIYNRNSFADRVKQIVLLGDENEKYLMLVMDIEQFKIVGQLFGSESGDAILKYIAEKLDDYCDSEEQGSCFCRVTDDKFAVFMKDDKADAERIMTKLQQAIDDFPLEYQITLCFGLFEVDDNNLDVNVMIDKALLAQKLVKGNFDHHYAYYDQKLKKKEDIKQMLVANMKKALEAKEFRLFVQPKCLMDTGEIVGAEVFVRWFFGDKGVILPGVFIPIFEQNGFIFYLDCFVWEHACQYLKQRKLDNKKVLPLSVNMSRADLYHPNIVKILCGILDKYDIDPKLLKLELTESAFVTDLTAAKVVLAELREKGFSISMDDFGSGYSSLNSLKNLSVDELKIDMEFLREDGDNERGRSILRYIIQMAKFLKMDILVEGVETQEQVDMLLNMDVHLCQGYLFHKPMPLQSYDLLLDTKK